MSRTQMLVLAGHGSQRHANSSAPLFAHAERIRATGQFDEVQVAFWKEEPALWDVRSVVETDEAYVVPVLTSEGYFADEVFPRELGLDAHPEIHYAEPVGTHERMANVIEARVESARRGPLKDLGVAVVGHGTERNAKSAAATERHAGTLRDHGRYAAVETFFLDEAPLLEDVYAHLDAPEIVVVPLFVADGFHTTQDIPEALGHPGVGESATIDGRLVHYTGAVGTEPSLADVIVQRAIEAGATPPPDSPGPRLTSADEAFVEWTDAPPSTREFGQLTITRAEGGYELRHTDDAGAPEEPLDALEDPIGLREHVRHDDNGRYRPLSGARTLSTGWLLSGVGATEILRAIEAVYPGSIVHWHRDRTGGLHATEFAETAARQTGLYADLTNFDQAKLAAATEAVCGRCVRSPQWNSDESDRDDAIPCREACPFFLTATHAFQESGDEAAAEPDRDVEPGALEDPANEFRVRYARALTRVRGESPLPAGGGPR